MKKYLGNPKTLQELHDALTKIPMEEIYDWHEQEAKDARQLKVDIDKNTIEEKEARFAIYDILTAKSRVHRELKFLCNYYETHVKDKRGKDMDGYFRDEKDFVYYCEGLQNFYVNCMELFIQNFKKCSVEDVTRTIVRIQHNIAGHALSEILKIFNLVIRKYVLYGDSPIDKALVHLWEIHSEDITRLHMEVSQMPEDKWPSLMLMLYVFGKISIDQLLINVMVRIEKNKESMQRYKNNYVGLYNRLREIYDDIEDKQSSKQTPVVQTEDTGLVSSDNLPGDKQMKEMNDLHQEIQALRIIKDTPSELLVQKLKPLKDIFSKQGDPKELLLLGVEEKVD